MYRTHRCSVHVAVICPRMGTAQVSGHRLGDSKMLIGPQNFNGLTDHKPLEGIFKKALFDLVRPGLQQLREKVSAYFFQVKWVPGKAHYIADALSCASLFLLKCLIQISTRLLLNYVQSKIYPGIVSELCRLCEEVEETF